MSAGPRGPGPLFFQRRTYRQRRMRDALRLLPVVGLFLWMLPLLWPSGEGDAPRASAALAYIFVIWAALIGAGAVIARRIGPADPEAEGGPGAQE